MPTNHPLVCMLALMIALFTVALPAETKERKGGEKAGLFIAETRISAPKRIGELVLKQSDYDPTVKYDGAHFLYILPQHPEIRFGLSVYRAGDLPPDIILKEGVEAFFDAIDDDVREKRLSDLEVIETIAFNIFPKDFARAKRENKRGASTRATSQAYAQRDTTPVATTTPKSLAGKRIDLRYKASMGDTDSKVTLRSRNYIFYKQMHIFKGWITVIESQMDKTTYEALSDRAIRELAATIQAANVGRCAENEIDTGKDDLFESSNPIVQDLLQRLRQSPDVSHRNCYATRDEAKAGEAADAEIITIEYDAEHWGEK